MAAIAQGPSLKQTPARTRSAPAWSFPVALALATALAASLALWRLGQQPFSRDEVATVTDAHRSLRGWLDVMLAREGNMWPYYLTINGWTHLGGTSEAWVRLPGAVAAIASVPAAMLLARRLFGVAAAVVTGVTYALLPFLMATAQEARSYSVLLLVVVLTAWLLVAAVERPRRRTWIAWGALAGASVHLHMLASLVVAAQAMSLLLLPRAAVPWRQVRAAAIAFAIVVAPMLVYAATSDSGQTSWIDPLRVTQLGAAGRTIAGNVVLAGLVALLVAGALWSLCAQLRREGRSDDAWRQGLVLGWIVLPPVALAVISAVKPLYESAYLTGVLPGVALAVGMVAARRPALAPPIPALAAPAVLGLTFGALVVTQATHAHPNGVNEDLRGAAQYVSARARPGDGVAYAPGFARVGFSFYLDRTHRPEPADLDAEPGRGPLQTGDLFGDELPASTVAANLEHARRVWLVGYPGDPWHPTPEPVLAVAPRILHDDFVRAGDRRWGQMVVTLYRHR